MAFLKKNYKYILFFIFLCFINYFLIYSEYTYDTTWEYGMSHALTLGQLPYRDYTLVTTPLFIFLFSIGLFIKDSLFVFILEFIICYTIMYYFLDKLIGNNKIVFLLSLCLLLFKAFIPTYNSLCLMFIIILMYMEKNNKNDYLIGFILGLLILTKHSIGLSILLFSFVGLRDFKRIIKRLLGCFIPIIIFTIYLVISNSLYQFVDLTILGLFDFNSKNTLPFNSYIILSLITLIMTIILIVKNKNEILLYYVLGSFVFVYPIVDISHYTYLFSLFIIPVIFLYNDKIKLKYLPYVLICLLVILNVIVRYPLYEEMKIEKFNHFEITFGESSVFVANKKIIDEMKKYDNIIIFSEKGSYYSIILDAKMNYFTIPHRGNYGYNGLDKMKNKFSNLHDTYVFLDYDFYNLIKKDLDKGLDSAITRSQFDMELCKYIMDNSLYIDKVEGFNIYYKE